MVVFRLKRFTEDYKILEGLRERNITKLDQLSSFELENPNYVAAAHRVINEKKISIKARLAKIKPKAPIPPETPEFQELLNKALKKI